MQQLYPALKKASYTDIGTSNESNSWFPEVSKKLRNHPYYRDASEDKITEQALFLSDESKMKEKLFAHLLKPGKDSIQEAMDEACDLPQGTYLTPQETREAIRRAEQRFADVCSLPMKLVLTRIGEGGGSGSKGISGAFANSKVGATLACLSSFNYGALHAALMVGDILLEWNNSSLIIPQLKQVTPVFQASLERFWNKFTSRYNPHMRHATNQGLDFNNQEEVMVIIDQEKKSVIDTLTREIVRYNTMQKYNLWNCNCQDFVWDIMKKNTQNL